MTNLQFSPQILDRSAVLKALRAYRRGDFSVRLPQDLVGIDGEIAEAFNDAVEMSALIVEEFARVRDAVGKAGQIGQRVKVPAAVGAWGAVVDSFNTLIGDVVQPTAEVARVIEAVAKGHLGESMVLEIEGRPLQGEFRRIGEVVNTMVGQLGAFASEVTRVAREVGTEGKLGGQAKVPGVGGTWKDLTDNVNAMAANLTDQVRNIAEVTTAVATGNLSKKITVDVKGEILELKSTINTMVDQLNGFASEVTRVAREVGTEGKLGGQAQVPGVAGTWKDLTDNVNSMAANLTGQVRNIADVTTAVAKGDLSKKITVDVKGEILELKSTINTMVDQLNGFASEVTRVAREVGSEGKLGGQAQVSGVAGTWKDLTDNVNSMAANLTDQVRNIAEVTTAVAKGDLSKKITVDAKGEILELKSTINTMVDQLNGFASEVSRVAREVGTEGKLGGQARVPGAAGSWRGLTDNVNQLAQNLTTQVRAIAEVATAVTKGDLTRSILVEAKGEVAALKDNINEMIRNLKDTTRKNMEQDWLKTNLARFTSMLQGQRDLAAVSRLVLSELAPLVNAQQGVFYSAAVGASEPRLELIASYAHRRNRNFPRTLRFGEGLIGQCARDKRRILLSDLPPAYIRAGSALGSAAPVNVVMLPVQFEGELKAVIELASLTRFSGTHLLFLEQLTESIGIVLNTIEANMRTEDLLKQSQTLTAELQSQQQELKKTNDRLGQQAESLQASEALLRKRQEELKGTNEQLEDKARLLSVQMRQVELKNREVEQARAALEEKAEQLALSSRYKSEFLANMSHELRTPLNSLLILAGLLVDNIGSNLTQKQIEYARTIHSAGTDLLLLINDILDLAKIESGTVTLNIAPERFSDLRDYVDRAFRQVAEDKDLAFAVTVDPALPETMETDAKRLQQILKNLVSNAVKFTDSGTVTLHIAPAQGGWGAGQDALHAASGVAAFIVSDTGIGIPANKHEIIFEAFQQADGTTSRQYGGTGLGLSITRELTRLLGGTITVESVPGIGSTFTLYLPLDHAPRADAGAPALKPPPAVAQLQPAYVNGAWEGRVLEAAREPVAEAPGPDDAKTASRGEPVVVVAEADSRFAAVLTDLAQDFGFRGVLAEDGKNAIRLIRELVPDAILLDLQLPDMDGWSVLDLVKHDAATWHIPVIAISQYDEVHRCLSMGALGSVKKPAARQEVREVLAKTREFIHRDVRSLLVVDSDAARRRQIIDAVGGDDVRLSEAESAEAALAALRSSRFDCMLLGPTASDLPPVGLLKQLARTEHATDIPVVMYGAADISQSERSEIQQLAEIVILKTPRSLDELLHETTLFLHRAAASLPPEKRETLVTMHKLTPELRGKKVLIVDDDIRNIFALTSVLEQHGMSVVHAESGAQGIELLKQTRGVDAVLMDIMMPELDGYDTIRIVRRLDAFREIPIIAVTAKAMKGDREKCVEAGASDYIAKPVNVEQLLSLLRVWLVN